MSSRPCVGMMHGVRELPKLPWWTVCNVPWTRGRRARSRSLSSEDTTMAGTFTPDFLLGVQRVTTTTSCPEEDEDANGKLEDVRCADNGPCQKKVSPARAHLRSLRASASSCNSRKLAEQGGLECLESGRALRACPLAHRGNYRLFTNERGCVHPLQPRKISQSSTPKRERRLRQGRSCPPSKRSCAANEKGTCSARALLARAR